LGHCYCGIGDIELAISEYKEAKRLDPKDPDAYMDLGNSYAQQGKLDLAIKECKC